MLRKASEVRHHSDEQVAEIVDAAIALAMREETPLPLAVPVFEQACALLAAKHIEYEQLQVNGGRLAVPRG